MRVVSRRLLREFWETHGREDSKSPLERWLDVAKKASWSNYDDVKKAYGSKVDLAHGFYVFDIGGNKYRLICRIDFVRHGVLTLHLCTHNEYDRLCADGGKLLRQL